MAAPPALDPNSKYPKWLQLTVKILFALLASAIVSSFKLDFIESYFYDLRVRTESILGFHKIEIPQIVLIHITSHTVERYQGFPKYKDHTDFLSKIENQKPRYILYDFRTKDGEIRDFNVEGDGDQPEKKIFADVVANIPDFHILTDELEMKGETGKSKLNPPLDRIKVSAAAKTYDTILFAKDGVSRRLMISYQDQKLLYPVVASYYNPQIQNTEKIRGQFELLDSTQAYVHFHPTGTFPSYSFEDVIDGKIPPQFLTGKIVILGTDTGKSAKEYVTTPFSREVNAMTSSEYHANVLQTLIDNSSPIRLPNIFNIILTSLISILTVYVVLALKPSRGLLILLMALIALIIISFSQFILLGLWIDLAHPFLAIFLCYYFFIPYRLIKENRRSWEYYQKNKLLSQVEELKTNFISMMSHDLKTPIARIQGMTEVISKDTQPLSHNQREAVDTIQSSSDDLLKFINSILQYGRIESQGLELNLQSKDVNQILKDIIKKHEFLSKVKKIKIEQNLEPLFPITIDPDLMRQVFSNLLENAIKYSPEDSVVTVSTKEIDNQLVIEFKDQGIGIPAEDLPNIFMKFFRSHNVKTSTIKGSGLGLYLANYFTELHKGKIAVTSDSSNGSTFTVLLPNL
jgi:signal transduction histidine kinase